MDSRYYPEVNEEEEEPEDEGEEAGRAGLGLGRGLPAGRLARAFAPGSLVCRQDLGGCAAAGRHLCTHVQFWGRQPGARGG